MIKSVKKAMCILRLLSDNEPNATTLNDISEKTGIPKPTCVHMLETLCEDGYALRVSRFDGYKLGPATYSLTRYGKYEQKLVSVCHPIMRWLRDKTNGIPLLAVIDNNEKYILDYIDTDNVFFNHKGDIFTGDIYRTATGRIIMSYMDTEDIRDIYAKHGNPPKSDWDGINSLEDLQKELQKVKKMSYVFTSTLRKGIYHIGLGKAIFKNKKCVGAIGIAFTSQSENAELFNDDILYLKKAAKEITRRLNYSD